jgi:hypothetical protein
MPTWIFVLSIPSLSSLVAWLAWLRFARHVYDKSGPEGLKALPAVAKSFRVRKWLIDLPARSLGSKEKSLLPAWMQSGSGEGAGRRRARVSWPVERQEPAGQEAVL